LQRLQTLENQHLSKTLSNSRTNLVFISLLLGEFLFSGCATAPPENHKEAEKPSELISSQSLSSEITVEQKSSLYKLKSEITLIANRAVRLDLTTTMDLPLATIVLSESKIQYLLYRDKKFYTGRPGPHALDPVFPLAVDASHLLNLLKEEKNPEDKCESDSTGLTSCKGSAGQTDYVISWSKRKTTGPLAGRASKIALDLPRRQVTLKFFLTDWQKNVPNAERLLSLKVPAGFRTLSTPER
jgi:hypothetical protein